MNILNRNQLFGRLPASCPAAVWLLASNAASGQTVAGFTVLGEIHTGGSEFWSELSVEVDAIAGGGPVTRAYVRSDGSFDLHDVPPGTHRFSVRDGRGEVVWQDLVSVVPGITPLAIDLAHTTAQASRAGTISL